MFMNGLFTSESVTEGHPDKLCDRISDAVLDAVLKQDPKGRVACETLVTTGLTLVAGEITTRASLDVPTLVRETIKDVGYTDATYGFDAKTCGVLVAIQKQSPDIAMGVDTGGAGDQGMMFGYACKETPELMPLPIMLAHQLVQKLAQVRKEGKVKFLRPDGKSQVTVKYEKGKPVAVTAVVVSTQHDKEVTQAEIRKVIKSKVIDPVMPKKFMSSATKIYVNPTGRFEVGGPHGDTGLTGRKIIVDTYGGMASHGGGCFSGKDPTKVDRSAAYMARYVAKNVVAAGLADRCTVQLAYAIGVAEPVSVNVVREGGPELNPDKLVKAIRQVFPLTPRGIIEHLQLRRPIYQATAAYGHFGREGKGFTWEKKDKANELRSCLGL
jgi:S-adenosylmethionine synthetase